MVKALFRKGNPGNIANTNTDNVKEKIYFRMFFFFDDGLDDFLKQLDSGLGKKNIVSKTSKSNVA
jgi:hypothetical protein